MSKNEGLKADIDFLKSLIIFFLTALFGVVGWIVTIRQKAQIADILLVGVAIVVLSAIISLLFKKIREKIKELTNLKERK
ncbi:hypothetical protein [Campylobacter mucosalis]|uniref:Putative membrane protein n=1 Tax=Campylobacter mucosalis CCUG 21559 TaxID=1032067 RepID=A0A6G5QEB2_9BACT|nr:hypothetical protein [Campylobacter mucosalis]KEA45844.1 hypothetical protein CR66_05435 [Campylobacter mucosalis]QCD44020.1 putative membrane protein [Campylobacter mucosalis CCUG 21559]QKF62376.1 putative membrane protein [Campylobacter mucosalis]